MKFKVGQYLTTKRRVCFFLEGDYCAAGSSINPGVTVQVLAILENSPTDFLYCVRHDAGSCSLAYTVLEADLETLYKSVPEPSEEVQVNSKKIKLEANNFSDFEEGDHVTFESEECGLFTTTITEISKTKQKYLVEEEIDEV